MASRAMHEGRVPQPGVPRGPRNSAKKRRKKAPEAAGPYRSQSSVPSIRKKATPREHRRVRPPASPETKARRRKTAAQIAAITGPKLTVGSLGKTAARQRQDEARQRRELAAIKKAFKGVSKAVPPDPQTAYQQARLAGIPPDPRLKSLPAPKPKQVAGPYRDQSSNPKIRSEAEAIERGYIVKPSPYKKAEKAYIEHLASKENLGEPEDLTTLITTIIPGAYGVGQIVKGAAKVGVSKLAGEAGSQLAGKGEAAVAKAVGIAASPKNAVRVTRNVGRRVTGKELIAKKTMERQFTSVVPGTGALKAAAGQTLPVVRGHERALVEHPKTTLHTTLDAAPGLVTAPIGLFGHGGATIGRGVSEALHAAHVPGFKGYSGKEIIGPIAGEANAQLEFAKQTAKIVTSDDPKEVQEAVENELGYMLPIMLALGGSAVGKKISKGKVTEAVRRVAENARTRIGRGHGQHNGQTPRVFEVSGQRKGEAVRTANARGRIKREVADRTQKVRAEAGKAKGKEVVRKGVVPQSRLKGLVKGKGDLTIHTGDLIGFAVRHALPLDNPRAALAEVKRIKSTLKALPEGLRTPADSLSTRDVINFIERNPKVLADKHLAAEVGHYKEQARYAREHPELEPEHSERARFTSTAVTRGIPQTQERFPTSIRGEVRHAPEPGRLSKDVLRREAKSDRSRAKKLRSKAAVREGKARAIRRELAIRQRAEPTRVKTNARVLAQADRMESQARTYRAGADKAEAMAKRKHQAVTEIDPGVNAEFVSEMQGILKREGKPEPEYVHTGKAREAPTYGATGAKLTQFPGASKFRKGSAEQYGLVQEGLTPTLRESIARPVSRRESYKAMKGFLDDNEFRAGSKSEWSSDEARALFEDGVIDRNNYVLVPRQLYKRSFTPDEWAGHLKTALDTSPKDALKTGRQFKIVRRAAAKEFFDQMGTELVSKHLAAFNRATAFLILGTSPAWAVAQIGAEFAQAAVAQPKVLNPAFIRKAMKAYKEMAPHKRQAFESWVGVTTRTMEKPEDLSLGMTSGDMEAAASAYGVFNSTPLGRLIKAIPNSVRAVDQWKGGRIRVLAAAAKVDGELNGRTNRFLAGMKGLDSAMGQMARDTKGQPLSRQLEYVAEHPEWAKHYQGYLDDVMGNWSALTRNERIASQAVIFYPFLRMSLRWTFYAFPKRHPVKMAALTYLGQANAQQVREMLGGKPSYFSQFAEVPLHLSAHGKPKTTIPLGRLAPSGNFITEVLGEDTEKPLGSAALRTLQPIPAAAITAATGVEPLSGEQKPKAGISAASQIINLSPISRAADELTLGEGRKRKDSAPPIFGSTERQESLDKLFAKLNEYDTTKRLVRNLAVPVLPKNLAYEKDLLRASNILDALSKNSSTARGEIASEYAKRTVGKPEAKKRRIVAQGNKREATMEAIYDRAGKELDGLFRKYKIPFKKEEGEFLQSYGELRYDSKPKTATSIGGLTIRSRPTEGEAGETTIGGLPIGSAPEKQKPSPKTQRKVTTIGGLPLR